MRLHTMLPAARRPGIECALNQIDVFIFFANDFSLTIVINVFNAFPRSTVHHFVNIVRLYFW